MTDSPSDARIALACMDLTSLGEDDTPAIVAALARRANTSYGTPAALCVQPEMLTATRMSLMREGIAHVRLATVVNFPDGSADIDRAERETRRALAAGANEIDVVFPWRAFLAGDKTTSKQLITRVKARCGERATLKVILESAAYPSVFELAKAASIAVRAGADFLKTSTGKVSGGASLESARCLLDAIAAAGRPVGLKVSGGIKTLAQARIYIDLAAAAFGRERVVPARFRIGASSLLDELLPALALEPAEPE